MIVIILAGSAGSELDAELQVEPELRGIPRSLLPLQDGKPTLDYWWETVHRVQEVTQFFVVCNASRYKYFERWATSKGLAKHCIINNGCSDSATAVGDMEDLQLALKHIDMNGVRLGSVCVIAGDLFFLHSIGFEQIVLSFRKDQTKTPGSSVVVCQQSTSSRTNPAIGLVKFAADGKQIIGVETKLSECDEEEKVCCLPLMILSSQSRGLLGQFLESQRGASAMATFGSFVRYVQQNDQTVFGVSIPAAFEATAGPYTLEKIRNINIQFSNTQSSSSYSESVSPPLPDRCEGVAYARVGLMGNPSDGYFGRTISATIRNFHATVWLTKSDKLRIVPHKLFDPCEFGSIGDLFNVCSQEGYHGGVRLLLATCKRFFQYCTENHISLPARNFSAMYDTNIPRQVGLAGSSAIVTAFVRSLMKFYGLTDKDIPKPLVANLILSVEVEEMGIAAGLQDRVVQVYGGLVCMDFNRELMEARGYGEYQKRDIECLPNRFFLAYNSIPSDSGAIHSDVKQRYHAGDQEVIEALAKFGNFAKDAVELLDKQDFVGFGELMSQNFEQRRTLFSDAVVGETNLELIEIGESLGANCKFPGSGGAIVGLAKSEETLPKLRLAYQEKGYVFVPIQFIDPENEIDQTQPEDGGL